jgi:hypothetical protein
MMDRRDALLLVDRLKRRTRDPDMLTLCEYVHGNAQRVPEVVALVRELHGQRQSLRQISKTLAAQGHLTGGGKPYTATAVRKMLRGG